jgi:FkbM family methyltransferase
MLRTLVERLSRGRAFLRRLDTPLGVAPLFVSPDAQLKYLKPGARSFDQDLVAIATELVHPGDQVWDIGANVGVFSAVAALHADVRVVAVEADAWLGQLLRRTAALSAYRPGAIDVLIAAISGHDGVERFQIAARGRASNALVSAGGRSMMGGVRALQLVPVLRLDTLAQTLGPPDVIKIDVEGAEIKVIEGALSLLKSHQPLVYAEIGREQFAAIAALIAPLGYRVFGTDRRIANKPGNENYFLVPTDRLSEPRFRSFS